MPSSLSGLLLFVALLAPGFVYHARRDSIRPSAGTTVLRETGTVVMTSLVFNVLAFGLFFVVHRVFNVGPAMQGLVDDAGGYARREWRSVAGWGVALLAFSCGAAAEVAKPASWVRTQVQRSASRLPLVARSLKVTEVPVVEPASAWQKVFVVDKVKDAWPHVGVELTDGTWVQGRHVSHNPEVEEHPARAIVLGPPLLLRRPGEPDLVDLGSQRLVLAPDQIRFLSVSYIPDSPPPAAAPASP